MRKLVIFLSIISVFFAQRVIGQFGQINHDSQRNVSTPFFAQLNYSRELGTAPGHRNQNNSFLSTSPIFPDGTLSTVVKRASTVYVNRIKTAATPTIAISVATGIISACVGSPSTSTQQFKVSGGNLTDNITVTAPTGFEISVNPAGGFSNTFFMVTQGSTVTQRTVYVRAIAGGAPTNLSGAVTLTSAGAATKKVAVKGTIYALPTVDNIPDQALPNGNVTMPTNFTGTGNTFYWTNDKPSIGLAASGQGDIAAFTAVNTESSPVVAHISVTSKVANVAYIPDFNSNTVLAINTTTNKVIHTYPVGAAPGLVAVSPDGKKVYIGNVGGTSLSIINTQTNQVKDISIFDSPTGLVFSKDGTRAYVAGAGGECTVIDVANDAVLTALTFFSGGSGIALSNDGKWIYATNYSMNDIRVYDTSSNAEIGQIPAPGSHYAITSADGKKIYAAGGASNCVWVIDAATNTLLPPININSDANIIALNPDESRMYITNIGAGTVTIVNMANNSIITQLPVGQSPEGVAFTPDGKYVYVVNADSKTISIIDDSNYTVVETIPAGLYPRAVGNFISPGINNCQGVPTDFKITVNTSPTTITLGTVGGLITTCIGAPSTSLQQFAVSGNNLSGNITATAPAGFEISFGQTSGFAGVLSLIQTGGAVTNKVIYVRAKASGTSAKLAGDVVLSTPGAATKNVAVKGVVNDLPTSNTANSPVYNNGDITAAIKFTGTANTYTWTNDKPSIGLAASGTGDIPSFTAINTGIPPVVANITVTPSSNGYLYLGGASEMMLVDADNNKQTGIISGVGRSVGTALSPDGTLIAVTDADGNTVKIINTTTHKVVSTINNIPVPVGICFSGDGKKVYVANETTFNVTIIDVATGVAESPIHVGVYPYGMAASPDGLTVYVAPTAQNAVIAIDTKTHQTTSIPVTFGPTGVAVSPDNSRVYATSAQNNGFLQVIDVASKSVIANVPVGSVSAGICISPDGKLVYLANFLSNNVMVVDAEINKVIATIPTVNHPFGLSITPDGKYVYVSNDGTNTVNVISTATNSIVKNITVSGQLGKNFGNFFVPGTGCTGTPTKFTITVNGSATITVSAVTGSISACVGSASTNTQQFKVSGNNLSNDVTATAPANFEVSLSPNSSFANSAIITQTGGVITNQVVYVRSAASAPANNISGNVILSSPGFADKNIAVNGVIHPLPIADQISDKNFNNGEATTLIHFTGNGTTYTWTNDNPAIGLPANGNGDLPSFTAVNNGQTAITATITVTPADASCGGNSMTFKIKVNATIPTITAGAVTGNIIACYGSPSLRPNIGRFKLTGTDLIDDVQIAAPANFEVSFNPNNGYANTITFTQTAGNVNSTDIYVRSASTAPIGHISGDITLTSAGTANLTVPVSGEVSALPTVNPLPPLITYGNGDITNPINFFGQANNVYTWTNDNPTIGLQAGNDGPIPSFTAINNGITAITANITVIPKNGLCTGNQVTFQIKVNPSPPLLTVTNVAGSIRACEGSASVTPEIQRFQVTGDKLIGDVLVTAPANFEISVNAATGYTNTLTLAAIAGNVNSTVYVRSSASAPAGSISGTVTISSTGLLSLPAFVSATITAIPVVTPLLPRRYNSGDVTAAITWGNTATTYTWTNDTPGIGLQANSTGNIAPFTAINNTTNPITATITMVPSNGSCAGSAVQLKITVYPTPNPVINFGSSLSPLNTVYGTPSSSGSFTVSGNNLAAGVTVTPPPGFEVSTDGVNFHNTITVGGAGTLNATTVYIRLTKSTGVGNYAGNIALSTTGAANTLPMPNSTVTPAQVIVVAENKSRPFRSENPPLTFTYSGFVNNETESNLVKKPETGTMATRESPVGDYVISFISTAQSPNYTFTYATGTLTITPSGVVLYNTFTPNSDGVNDTWAIKYIEYYPKCTVDIFNRWGAKVYTSIGYGKPWDGQSIGGPVPVGTYYYVINLKDGSSVKSGWVAIVR